jgi:hypothetical protein
MIPRLRRLGRWLDDDCPLFPGIDLLGNAVHRLGCLLHGHAEFLEMDNRSVCCAYCGKLVREKT